MTVATASQVPAQALEIRPQPGPQERFLRSSADIAVFGGARGPGKTFALLMESLRHVNRKGFNAVLFRRTYPEVTQAKGLWQQSYELYPALRGKPRLGSLEWLFPAGTRIKFAHMQYDQDRMTWKGAQIALLGFDQLETFTADQFWFLLSCNRSTCGIRPYVRAACNPVLLDDPVGGWLHQLLAWWIHPQTGEPIEARAGILRWFVRDEQTDQIAWADAPEGLKAEYPTLTPRSLTFIPGKLEDNVILETADPGYRAGLMSLPRVERLRAFGNWLVRAMAGSVFDRAWFEIVPAGPAIAQRARAWDKAGTEAGGDWSVGARLARTDAGIWYVEDVVRGRWSANERNTVIRQVAAADGPDVEIWIEQEPGSGGKESAEISVRELAGYVVRADRPTGEILARAQPLAAQAEAGNVKLVAGAWNETFLRECHDFPDGGHDDQVSATALAFNKMALVAGQGEPHVILLGKPTKVDPHDDAIRAAAAEALRLTIMRQGAYWPSGR
jgi:predicted phage terminase large subunit-like protein